MTKSPLGSYSIKLDTTVRAQMDQARLALKATAFGAALAPIWASAQALAGWAPSVPANP